MSQRPSPGRRQSLNLPPATHGAAPISRPALMSSHILQLQQTIGNQRTARHLAGQQPVQRYVAGYQPRLAGQARANNGQAYNQATFQRPLFDDATINRVYRDAPQQTAANPINQRQEQYYQCARCLHWSPYEAMQIGHITTWARYLAGVQPADTAEARDAYNDLDNLQLECSTCNGSHAWEGGSDSDSDSDASDSDDSFIDDTEADPAADADAMREVRQWAAAASQPGGVQPWNDAAAASSGPVNRNVTIRRRGPGGGGTGGAGAGGGTQLSQD